jgi:penicillin-binding protein-related factor A (putative recombinase)
MTFTKRIAGRKAYRRGKSLEDKIERIAEIYISNGSKIELIRNYDAMQKSRKGAFTVGKSSCDYSLFTPENSGMIEAKARGGKSIRKDAVSEHQTEQLLRLKRLGCYAFVIVQLECDDPNSPIFLVDIKEWLKGEKKSHNLSDLKRIGKECDKVLGSLPDILKSIQ